MAAAGCHQRADCVCCHPLLPRGSIASVTVLRGPPSRPEIQCVVAQKQGKACRLSPSPVNSVLEMPLFHLLTLCKHFGGSLVLYRGSCLTKHRF